MTPKISLLSLCCVTLALGAPLASSAQVDALWTDLSHLDGGGASLHVVTPATVSGGYLLAGQVQNERTGFLEGLIARVEASGELAWSYPVRGVDSAEIDIAGLVELGPDRVRAVYTERSPGLELGKAYDLTLARSEGGDVVAEVRELALPGDRLRTVAAISPVPGSDDVIVAGLGADDVDAEADGYVARLADGPQPVWVASELTGSDGFGLSQVTSLAVRDTVIYVPGEFATLIRVSARTGEVLPEVSAPGAASGFSKALLAVGDGEVAWALSSLFTTEVFGVADGEVRAIGTVTGDIENLFGEALHLVADSTGVRLFGLAGRGVSLADFPAGGGEPAIERANLRNWTTPYSEATTQVAAATPAGNLLIAGRGDSETGGSDGLVARVGFGDRLATSDYYRLAGGGAAPQTNLVAALPRDGGGVYLLSSAGGQLALRTLGADGTLVGEGPVETAKSFNAVLGAAVDAAGRPVVLGQFVSDRGTSALDLLVLDDDGTVAETLSYGELPNLQRFAGGTELRRNAFRNPDGELTVFFTWGRGEDMITEILSYDEDLELTQSRELLAEDCACVTAGVEAVAGSDDYLLYGAGERGIEPFALRLTPDSEIAWSYVNTDLESGFFDVQQLVQRPGGETWLINEEFGLQRLDSAGRLIEQRRLRGGDARRLRFTAEGAAGTSTVAYTRVDTAAGGLPFAFPGAAELNPDTYTYEPIVSPAVRGARGLYYVDGGARTYLAGEVGSDDVSGVFVVAFPGPASSVASPTPARHLSLAPNPVASRAHLRLSGAVAPETLYVFDVAGRPAGTLTPRGGQVQLPSLPAGWYRLRGVSGGEVYVATIVVSE